MVVGFNGTFFILHFAGLAGMPRRVYTYPDWPHLATINLISSLFAYVLGLGVLVFFVNLAFSLFKGKSAVDNPWNGWTLEWATSSPPPPHNFERIPPVSSIRPLLDLQQSGTPADPAAPPTPRGASS
jgi:heme/copper-type cytochrome/quinol oxidase subunit 1